MTFWRNVCPNMLLQGQNAVLVLKKPPQNFYQCTCSKGGLISESFPLCINHYPLLFRIVIWHICLEIGTKVKKVLELLICKNAKKKNLQINCIKTKNPK